MGKITHAGAGFPVLQGSEAPPAHGRTLSIGRSTEVPRSRWLSWRKGPGLRASSPAARRKKSEALRTQRASHPSPYTIREGRLYLCWQSIPRHSFHGQQRLRRSNRETARADSVGARCAPGSPRGTDRRRRRRGMTSSGGATGIGRHFEKGKNSLPGSGGGGGSGSGGGGRG